MSKLHAIFGGKNAPQLLVGGASARSARVWVAAAPRPPRPQRGHAGRAAPDHPVHADLRRSGLRPTRWPSPAFWLRTGSRARRGPGQLLTVGDFRRRAVAMRATGLIPAGVILGRDLKAIQPLDLRDRPRCRVRGALLVRIQRRQDAGCIRTPVKPGRLQRAQAPTSSWTWTAATRLKSPRWRGKERWRWARWHAWPCSTPRATSNQGAGRSGAQDAGPTADRDLLHARPHGLRVMIESKVFADQMQGWLDQLMANIKAGDLARAQQGAVGALQLAARIEGRGLHGKRRAARCATTSSSRDGLIDNLPGGRAEHLNAGPRDANGQPAPTGPR